MRFGSDDGTKTKKPATHELRPAINGSRALLGCRIYAISLLLATRRCCAAFRPSHQALPTETRRARPEFRRRIFGDLDSRTVGGFAGSHRVSAPAFVSAFISSDPGRSVFIKSKNMSKIHTTPQETTEEAAASPHIAKVVPLSSLEECGERLRRGELVSFPTETVYGLGCNAMDETAIHKVFAAKERPLTDPLIVHVASSDDSFPLWEATIKGVEADAQRSLQSRVLRALCERFWPGPLTVVAKAAPHVPSTLMAGTGFVACRSPSHPIARALIQAARVPIAAPSANKFGHVSPTAAKHVWDDLKDEDVWIVQGDDKKPYDKNGDGEDLICDIGVESTVIKVEEPNSSSLLITMLRQGAVSTADISAYMETMGVADQVEVISQAKKMENEGTATVAPGQSIRHYSPNVPSFILARSRCQQAEILSEVDKSNLSKTVIIDFAGTLGTWKALALAYRDLNASGDSAAAAQTVFGTLRWAEQVTGADRILFPELDTNSDDNALLSALRDRLTRAASGVVVDQIG